jgi:hypothetical protein
MLVRLREGHERTMTSTTIAAELGFPRLCNSPSRSRKVFATMNPQDAGGKLRGASSTP